MDNSLIQIRTANSDDIPIIYTFIQQKSEFDRSVGAYSGRIQTSEEKISQTIFAPHPFAHVLLAENNLGFALYGFRYSSFAGQPSIWLSAMNR